MPFPGSGIYAPDSPRVFHYDMKTEEGKLLLAQLDSHPHPTPVVNWTSYASGVEAHSMGNQEFTGTVFFDEFTFLELKEIGGNYTVCQRDLCCHLSYKMSEKRSDEVYALGAFDGLHTVEGSYYLQVMIVLVARELLDKTQDTQLSMNFKKKWITFIMSMSYFGVYVYTKKIGCLLEISL